jgi:hypothetical protein
MPVNNIKVKSTSAKALQSLIALACWAIIVEKKEMNLKGIHQKLHSYYHGDLANPDMKSRIKMCIDGEGRFSALWDDNDTIPAVFGQLIAGLTKRQVKANGVLDAKTLSKPNNKLGN